MKLGFLAVLLLVFSLATRNLLVILLLIVVSTVGLAKSLDSKDQKKNEKKRSEVEKQHPSKPDGQQNKGESRNSKNEATYQQTKNTDNDTLPSASFSLRECRLVLHPDLQGLIWFIDGPLKNYDPPISKTSYRQYDLTVESLSRIEPSAIQTGLNIILPKEEEYISPLGYYPSYASITPKQRGRYIQFLSNPYQVIDIGYVFILYYGLERHLLMGDFDSAFDIILRLRGIHSNDSFQHYSTAALVYSASRRNRKDKLRCFIESVTNEFEKQAITFDVFISVKAALGMNILPIEMMRYATSFAFTNKRYIQSDYSIFGEQLALVLQEKYNESSLPIRLLHLDGLPAYTTGLANYSISATFEVPNISADHSFIEAGASALQEAHDRVKVIKRARSIASD